MELAKKKKNPMRMDKKLLEGLCLAFKIYIKTMAE